MLSWVLRISALCVCFIFIQTNLLAQFTVQHQAPTAFVRGEPNALEFIVPGINQNDVQEATLFFNFDQGIGFQQQEVIFQNGVFNTNLEINDLNASSVEYYFQLNLTSGSQVFYPENSPTENPIRVDIVSSSNQQSTESVKRNDNIEYNILSPEAGNALAPNDVVIAISLYYDINEIDPGEFRLFIDNRDVTELADTSDYFISYVPKNLKNGRHTIKLQYHTESDVFLITSWDFDVVDPSKARSTGFDSSNRNRPAGRIELGARSQKIAGNSNDAYTARTNISGNYGLFRYSLNGFFTSQESDRLQPQNRYGLDLQLGKWLRFNAGHVYPNISRFTISGRRVFGINTQANLLKDNFNVQFVYGEVNRKINNLYSEVDRTEITDGNNNVVDTTYTLQFQDLGKGTFTRKITAARIALGNERHFQVGVHAMKVEDDTASIFNVRNFNSLLNAPPSLYSNLNEGDFQKLESNPELLQIQNGSVRPQGNFVAGTTLKMGFAKNRIRLESETVASALNNDIYGGSLTVQGADDLGFDITQDDADLLESLSQLIIINENMNILPIRVKDFNTDSSEAEPFFPTSILGSNTEFSINYPSNNFKLQYRWVGPNFSSLANSTVRKDISGFTASDRFRMFKNRLYVTLGYETLEDNVTNNKSATTESNTYRTNLSWYPVSRKLPRMSFGFRFRDRENGVARFNPNVDPEFEKSAVQNFVINVDESGNIDTLVTPVPKQSKTLNLSGSLTQQFDLFNIIHDASLSFNNLSTTDEVFAFGDVSSSAVSFNITSRFNTIRLRTQLGLTFNNTETGSGQTDIDIFGLYGGVSYFLLDGKLNINGRLAITSNTSRTRSLIMEPDVADDDTPENDYFILSPNITESDFSTFVIQAGAQYDINEYHSFIFDSNFTNVSGIGSSNDSIVTLRYLFNF
ncbi:MAG: hypothetical protein RLN83_04195 [Balneola sp.]